MRSIALAMTVAGAVALGTPMAQAASAPADYAQTARNIIPSGEPGGFPFPVGARVRKGSRAPSAQAARMLSLLVAWDRAGGHVLDLNGDGKVDNPGDAIIDAAWPKIANAFMKPVIGPQLAELGSLFSQFDAPPGGQYNGWYQYFDRDIKRLLKIKQPQPFANRYCGNGNLHRCQQSLWAAIAAAGRQLAKQQGTATPSTWRASSTALNITFAPLNPFTMSYTNRPSGIQQVISFDGHR